MMYAYESKQKSGEECRHSRRFIFSRLCFAHPGRGASAAVYTCL